MSKVQTMSLWVTAKKYLKPVLVLVMRIAGIIAVYKICTTYDWNGAKSILEWKSIFIVAGALVIYAGKLLVDALRNKRLATPLQIPIPFAALLKFNVQSVAFDFALPVPQAEEFYRFGRMISYTNKKNAAMLAVGLRFTGLFATVCSLWLTIIFSTLKVNSAFSGVSTFRKYFVLVDLAIALLLIFFLFVRIRLKKNPDFLSKGLDALKLLNQFARAHKYYLLEGIGLAFVSQLIYASSIFFICVCNGAEITFFNIFLIVPLIYFGGLIPVGMAGLGIKEAVIAWALQQFGVSQAIAWNIALFHFVVMVIYLLLGAILLLAERKTVARLAPGG
jgi:uncharacterized membrane protein YbhN (UPF0104 family)